MRLIQTIYCSRAISYVDKIELQEIAAVSAKANKAREVTGTLLFCGGFFLQLLEGDVFVLMPLIEKIGRDPRHRDLQVLSSNPASERMFPDWQMSCMHEDLLSESDQSRIAQITGRLDAKVDVRALGTSAMDLLGEMRFAIDNVARETAKAA